jgi:hypothetical protein
VRGYAERREDKRMNKQMMNVADVAALLTQSAEEVGLDAFTQLAEDVLEDNSPGEIEAIGSFMPPELRDLLPKRTLH